MDVALGTPATAGDRGALSRDGVVVDVLFLCIMDAHERLDGFDDALSVADQISVGIARR